MKRKLSMLILTAFCLCTLVIGIYSVKNSSVNITGNIEFSVHSPKLNGSEGWEGTWDSSYNITLTGVPASATSGATLEIPEFFYCLDNLKTPASTTTIVNAVVDEDLTIEEELSLLDSQGVTWGKGHVKVLGDGTNAIKRMSNYSKINFANVTSTLSSISYRAFYNSNLTSLNLSGTSVTTIGSSAFLNSALTKVELANSSVSTLGNGVFEGNTNLQTITLSKKITVLPNATFANCKALSTIDLSNITSIGDSCFLNAALSSVNIHNGITSIGAEAFNSCAKLTSLTFGEGSTNLSIGANAFKYCTGIKTLNLPSRLTYMGEDAFANCSAINSITTPFVGREPVINNFDYEKQYHRVTWSFPTTSLTSITITGGKGNYTLHQYAFNQYSYGNSKFSALKSVTLGANVTTIDPMALGDCSGITYFSSPIFAGYTEGGAISYDLWKIFAEPDGSSPKEYGLPTELTFDFTGTDATFANGSLSYCNIVSFTNSTNTLTSIPNSKFSGLSKLTKIFNDGNKIPANVTAIGNYAFQNCTSLTNVDMSNNKVATLGTNAFSGCSALNNIILSSILTKLQDNTFQKCTSLQTINMKNIALTELGASVFSGCTALRTIDMSGSKITTLGSSVFSSCTALQMVDMRNSDITTLGSRIFHECSKLQNVYLSSKTTVLPDRAFMNCTVLNMPDISNVISLGDLCFASCKAILSVTIHNKLESIANYCFANCTSLSSLAFEEGSVALSIGNGVFLRNAITSVTLPQRLVSMSYGIFADCKQLTSISTPFVGAKSSFDSSYNFSTGVEHKFLYLFSKNASASTVNSTTLPASLKSVTINGVCDIAKDAFTYTTTENGATVNKGVDITSLTIGNKVKSIGINAFGNCKSLQTVTFNDYTGSDYDANKLIVYEDAFHSCTSLVSVNIPYRMYSLGDGAFANCTALSSLTFANRSNSQNLTLGEYCFKNNDALTTLTIPTNVINIPEGAFYDCDLLKTINLPNDLRTVGNQAFYNCVKLSSISFPASTYMIGYQSFFQCYALGSITFNSQIDGLSIHDQAFYGSGIESIVIPDGTKEIGANVFQYCGSLKSITLPFVGGGYILDASVKPEGYDKFNYILNSNANQITNVTITGNIAWDGGISKIYSNAFAGLTNLQTVTIGNGVKIISLGAFSGCTGITTMTIPFTGESADATTGSIGTSHFSYIFGAEKYTDSTAMPTSLKVIWHGGNIVKINSFTNLTCLNQFIDENNAISQIGDAAFYGCKNLSKILNTNNTIGTNMTNIGANAFYECSSLNAISFGTSGSNLTIGNQAFFNSGISSVIVTNRVISIGDSSFKNCNKLTSLTFSNGNKRTQALTLGDNCFENCVTLSGSIYLSDLGVIVNIPKAAFKGCNKLDSIYIDGDIGSFAFDGCENLNAVRIVGDGQKIYEGAFSGCKSLEYINLPITLAYIGNYAFQNCINISEIELPFIGNQPGLIEQSNAVFGCIFNANASQGMVGVNQKYSDNNSIEYFIPEALKKVVINGSNDIPYGAFSGCTRITDIEILSGAKWINNYAFYNCSSLEGIIFPTTLTSIGESCFELCEKLNSNNLGACSNLTTIKANAFKSCIALTYITIPASVTNFGNYIFSGCFEDSALGNQILTFEKLDSVNVDFYKLFKEKDREDDDVVEISNLSLYIEDYTSKYDNYFAIKIKNCKIEGGSTSTSLGDLPICTNDITISTNGTFINPSSGSYTVSVIEANNVIFSEGYSPNVDKDIMSCNNIFIHGTPTFEHQTNLSSTTVYISNGDWLDNSKNEWTTFTDYDGMSNCNVFNLLDTVLAKGVYIKAEIISKLNYMVDTSNCVVNATTIDGITYSVTQNHTLSFAFENGLDLSKYHYIVNNAKVLLSEARNENHVVIRRYRKKEDGFAYTFVATCRFSDGNVWRMPVLLAREREAAIVQGYWEGSWHDTDAIQCSYGGEIWYLSTNSGALTLGEYYYQAGVERLYIDASTKSFSTENERSTYLINYFFNHLLVKKTYDLTSISELYAQVILDMNDLIEYKYEEASAQCKSEDSDSLTIMYVYDIQRILVTYNFRSYNEGWPLPFGNGSYDYNQFFKKFLNMFGSTNYLGDVLPSELPLIITRTHLSN